MNLKQYLAGLGPDERKAYAKRAGTNTAYLTQLAGEHRQPSPAMARRLSDASDGEVTLAELRPDIWSEVA